MAFACSICGEESTRICARCTKDACDNHLCEKCRRCSDCCECEVRLTEPAYAPVRPVIRAVEPESGIPEIEEHPEQGSELPFGQAPQPEVELEENPDPAPEVDVASVPDLERETGQGAQAKPETEAPVEPPPEEPALS